MTKKTLNFIRFLFSDQINIQNANFLKKNRPIIVTIFYKQEFIHKIYRFSKKSKIA